jgi:hypothetical protein
MTIKGKSLSGKKWGMTVLTKTGYQLDKIYLASSEKLFGIMPSFLKPHLIISQALFRSFDEDETEYVLLHEMAHFLLHHVLTELILGFVFLVAGIIATVTLGLPILLSFLLGLLFGVIMIRFGRLHEYEADAYALSRMTNPDGMITATEKFQAQSTTTRIKLIEELFYRGNPFINRIKMAKREISNRQQH